MSSVEPAAGTPTSVTPGQAPAMPAEPEYIEPGKGIFGDDAFPYTIEYRVFRYSGFENVPARFDIPEQAIEYAEAHGYHLTSARGRCRPTGSRSE
ncbi:hypothetical protein ACVBEQ_25075 [Nakamurella sp. GG22]